MHMQMRGRVRRRPAVETMSFSMPVIILTEATIRKEAELVFSEFLTLF